ncbi:Uncharacterised protein [Metamycoplasma arthritidis]|uniref:ABC transporter permease n=1 Tax=Metamycoplasma arthritidis (strain 158L3-1) TaxID=243272 RepID=B3PN05_META1|nr:ABC transporter permease [Metamycoplasma arthritidis]ACF07407.1 hypothetical protein, putative ABC transporter permease protein [Metamycoplasma arthritidis 158L3-1]VEU78929.1 Uncharacterised protein [Metamycoplasma arthritidis]
MRIFFQLQLKIFYRQISSYVAAVVIGFLNICMALALYISIKVVGGNNELIKTPEINRIFRGFMIFFAVASSFVISAFAMQTLFYKYKSEGIYYVMHSKPIKRSKIYIATILAGLIVLTSQTAIISVGYFIGTMILPSMTWKAKILSSLTFYLGCWLIAVFSLALGSIVNNYIQSKSYQFAAAWVPIIITLLFSFIATPPATKANVLHTIAPNQLVTPVKEKPNEDEINQLAKRISDPRNNTFEYSIENKLDEETFSESVNESNRNLYRGVYWADPNTYFSSMFFLTGREDNRTNEFMYTKKYNYTEQNFQTALKNKHLVFKTIDTDVNGNKVVNYYTLSYNRPLINELGSIKSNERSLLGNYLKNAGTLKIREQIRKAYIDIEKNLLSKLNSLYDDPNFVISKNITTLTPLTLLSNLAKIAADSKLFEIIRDFTVDHTTFPNDPQYDKETLKKLTKSELESLSTNPTFSNFILKYNLAKQSALLYLLVKLIQDKANGTLNNFNYKTIDKYLSRNSSLSALKIVQLNNNKVINFGTREPLKWYYALLIWAFTCTALITVGAIIFKKGNLQ